MTRLDLRRRTTEAEIGPPPVMKTWRRFYGLVLAILAFDILIFCAGNEGLLVNQLDWIVLVGALAGIVGYGVWLGRRATTLDGFILSDRGMRWHTVLFSIIATQASAITFISTPGQAYVDGMRFVQFYLGLPIGMIILSVTAVPIYHGLRVYTAYEFLERRFDVKTRTLTARHKVGTDPFGGAVKTR